jgi:hypothetical protein
VVQDTDAGIYSDISGQDVGLNAPLTIGTNQTEYSVLINNVSPANSTYTLQNGLLFWGYPYGAKNGTGIVMWTSSYHNLVEQDFNIPYIGGDQYNALIEYVGEWEICNDDLAYPSTWTCVFDPYAPGSAVGLSANSSVWFENWNQNWTDYWYQGFSNPLSVFNATIIRPGGYQDWGTQARVTIDNCQAKYPAQNAISGSILNEGFVYFHLDGVPLYC